MDRKTTGRANTIIPCGSAVGSSCSAQAQGVTVGTAEGWPSAKQFETADVIVFYSSNPGWTAEHGKELDRYLERGGGLVYLHWAVEGHDAVEALAERIGLASKTGKTVFRHGKQVLDFTGSKHPIAHNFGKVTFEDESYWKMIGDSAKINVIATGVEEGKKWPLLWTYERGKGRIFVNILGHYTWTFDDPLFRILVLRGIAWSAGEPVDRFNELATIRAREGN